MDVWRHVSILQFPLENQDAFTEGKERKGKHPEVHRQQKAWPCHWCSAARKGSLGGTRGKIISTTWGIYQVKAFLRMPPKLCSLTQPVTRTVRHKFFRLKFDVGEFPKKSTQDEEMFFQEREKSPFIINRMKLLISRKPHFLWIGRSEFPQYTDNSIILCTLCQQTYCLIYSGTCRVLLDKW